MNRVVVTGMGGVTAFGTDWAAIHARLRQGSNATVYVADWESCHGLNARLAAPIPEFALPEHYTRKQLRTMGRGAQLAVRASELALRSSGLLASPELTNGSTGIAYGSSAGSPPAIAEMGSMIDADSARRVNTTSYSRMMPHTAAVNVSLCFGIRGRLIPTSSACTSGSQAIGYAYETIRHGYQPIMLAGGADELSTLEVAVFDCLFAASRRHDAPRTSPRPFDTARDGLVIGEGASSLVLESLPHAQARGATILAEIVGFATNCNATHVIQPDQMVMQACLQQALDSAGLDGTAIDCVLAHATATELADIAESHAIAATLGNQTRVTALKSFLGHTLGACGAIESWLGIEMMRHGWFNPILNLEQLDPRCAELNYLRGSGQSFDCRRILVNNFAIGGINTALIIQRWQA